MTAKKGLYNAEAHWDLQLYYDCPACEGYFNYLDGDDYNCNDGWEGMPAALKAGKHQIVCKCGAELLLNIKQGL